MQETTFEKEKSLWREDLCVIGIDEVGRGPLAGPVVAAAAWYKNPLYEIPKELEKTFRLVRDSKTLSPKQREKMHDFVQEHFLVSIGMASVAEIDRINILQASLLAMKRAVADLKKRLMPLKKYYLLIDGNHKLPHCEDTQETVIGGDSLVKSIAAASIVAKVTRDRLMEEYDMEYPAYGFARHKGYGTREHMEALRKHGATLIHRLSFVPVMMTNPENVNKKFAAVLGKKRELFLANTKNA